MHTIINDNAWDAKQCLDFGEGIDNSAGVGEVTLDVDLVSSVVRLCCFPRGQSDPVAFGRKSPTNALTNIGPCTENKDDRGFVRHDASCTGRTEATKRTLALLYIVPVEGGFGGRSGVHLTP